MGKVVGLISWILVFLCTFAIAQERLPAEELLHFFPMGDYEAFNHEETAALLTSTNFEIVQRFSRFAYTRWTAPFPKEFMNEADSITSARKVKVFVYIRGEGEKAPRKNRGSMSVGKTIGDVSYRGEGVGEDLFVFRFVDLPAVLKKYLESGVIVETGKAIGKRMVYTTVRKDRRGLERTMYMAAFETGELLAAEKPATLNLMIATGLGEEASVLGDPTYLTFEEALEFKGQIYEWITFNRIQAAIVKYAEKKDHSSEDLEKARNSMGQPYEELAQAHIWDLSDPPVESRIRIYKDEDGARKEMEIWSTGLMRAGDPYTAAVQSAMKYSVEGNQMITTITYDKETFEKFNEAREIAIKKYQEQQKQKEEKSDEKK